jgi:dTDP-4-dehydrorhamnose reductase
MKVLVTGAGGQLGHDVVAACSSAGDDVVGTDLADLDVTRRSDVAAVVAEVRPDVVIHCAAWTAVDACESDPDRAFAANADAVRWMREASELAGAHLVTLSTDYVFDGTLDRPYHERDVPNPRSVYGRSKLAGEREAGPDATVVRTSWICGEHGSNIVRTVLRLAAEHDTLAFVDDQRGCPTFAADLAPMLRRLAVDRRTGIHHVTNQGPVTWYEFARSIVAAMGKDPAMVRPISTADLDPPRPAERPANSVLDNAVLRAAGLPLLRDHRQPLAELITRLTR